MFTADQYVTAVREVLKERGPDYVYRTDEGCYYRPDVEGVNNPMCLHGAAFERLGVLDDPRITEGMGVGIILERFDITDQAVLWAARLSQLQQDSEAPYGEVATAFECALSESDTPYGTEKQ